MLEYHVEAAPTAVPVTLIPAKGVEAWQTGQSGTIRAWLEKSGFKGKTGALSLIPADNGSLAGVVFVVPDTPTLWDFAELTEKLPGGAYTVAEDLDADAATHLALAWALAGYRFSRYKQDKSDHEAPQLVWPTTCRRDEVSYLAEATGLVRDLINTPAADMGPDGLAQAAQDLASKHGAAIALTIGDELLTDNFPAIHAVGRANSRAPRLIDLTWGSADAPKVTLVGKGVCFDTGGLNIKSAAGMKLMKKDMGGAAHVLGAADALMASGLNIRLRVLVPAVENSIAGNAMRPGDVLPTRKGLTIEIGNTDAEGRVILSDALTEAVMEKPEVIIDFATLTGSARVALGTELPALFCNDDDLADGLLNAGKDISDPLWRMPLWADYDKMVDGKVADLNNAPEGSYGGSITAALFLQRFIDADISWAHIDLMAWNLSHKPGRPEGGEAMGMRALVRYLQDRYGA